MTVRLVHLAAAAGWLVVLVQSVGLRLGGLLPEYVGTRDLLVGLGGAVVVGLCLSGTRRPWALTWAGVALAVGGTVVVLVQRATAVERVNFGFVAGRVEHGRLALVAALLVGLAVGLLLPALALRARGRAAPRGAG